MSQCILSKNVDSPLSPTCCVTVIAILGQSHKLHWDMGYGTPWLAHIMKKTQKGIFNPLLDQNQPNDLLLCSVILTIMLSFSDKV
eukprot:15361782-Ditylum_brightwellii.AAC.1